jgi:pyridoxal/pyridoxine/pyridoxamine kinase
VNCAALERMLSGSPAVRRAIEKFERMQIWISDPTIGDLAEKQAARMLKQFDTMAIPLHVVLAPDGTELARFEYSPLATADDYVKFLEEGLAKFAAR